MNTKPSGLYYIPYIGMDYKSVISRLDELDWQNVNPKNTDSRVVQHYGYKYDYNTSAVKEKGDEMPPCISGLKNYLTRTCLELKITDDSYKFNQCIINNYTPGQGISAHVDIKSYGDVIGCFTLGSGTTMVFEKGDEKYEIYVEPNSLYIMSGDSRYKWKHSMPARKSDVVNGKKIPRDRRVSVTFRMVR